MGMSNAFAYARCYDNAGDAIGDIWDIAAFTLQRTLHGIGSGNVSIALTDATSRNALDAAYRVTVWGGYDGDSPSQIYDGIVSDKTWGLSGGELVYTFLLDDRMIELARQLVPPGYQWVNAPATDVVGDLLQLVSGWSTTFIDGTLISLTANGGTVYDVLKQVAANFGYSIRASGTVLSIGDFGTVQDCLFQAGGMFGVGTGTPVNFYSVTELDVRRNERDIINRIYPLMAGNGSELDSGLYYSTLSSPYVIQRDLNSPNFFYLADADSENAYGVRAMTKTYNWIAPIGDSIGAKQMAANMLYREAAEDLDHYKTPQTVYGCTVAGSDVWGLPFTVGDKVTLRVTFPSDLISNIDSELWVQDIEWIYSTGNLAVRVTLTTINRPDKNGLSLLQDAIGDFTTETLTGESSRRNNSLPEFTDPPEPTPNGEDVPFEEEPPPSEEPPPPAGVDSGRACNAAGNVVTKFFATLSAAVTNIDVADQATMVQGFWDDQPLTFKNLAVLTEADLDALWAMKADASTLNTQIADAANKTNMRTWLYCLGGTASAQTVSDWITNKSSFPTELKALATIIALSIAETDWAAWRAAGTYTTDGVTCASYTCDAIKADRLFFIQNDGSALWRTLTFTYAANYANISPSELNGQIMDFAQVGEAGGYLLTYSAAEDESTLWYNPDILRFAPAPHWVAKQTVSGRYTRLGVSSTSGAGWIYTPAGNNWVNVFDFTVDEQGWSLNNRPSNAPYTPITTKGAYSAGVGWTHTDGVNMLVSDGRFAREVQIGIAMTLETGSKVTSVSMTYNYTRGTFAAPGDIGAWIRQWSSGPTIVGSVVVNGSSMPAGTTTNNVLQLTYSGADTDDLLTIFLRSSIQPTATYSGSCLITKATVTGEGVNPFTTGTGYQLAATRHFTSNGDTIADEMPIGVGYDISALQPLGAIGTSGAVIFAATRNRIRTATSGGAYTDYDVVSNVIGIAANSTTTAAYATPTEIYYDGTLRACNDGSADAQPFGDGSRGIAYGGTRLFVLADFGATVRAAYSDDNGVNWSFRTVDSLATCIAARASDELYVGTSDETAQYGDPASALTDVDTERTGGALALYLS